MNISTEISSIIKPRALKISAKQEEDYIISLPSGRNLVYRDCHFAKTSSGKTNVKTRMGGGRWGFTWGSKLFENCLSGETEVFTDSGWKQILQVSARDLVFDGVEFVSHGGIVAKGEKNTLCCHGIWATPDHKFLTQTGWEPAEKACLLPEQEVIFMPYEQRTPTVKIDRSEVWTPYRIGGCGNERKEKFVACEVRLRYDQSLSGNASQKDEVLQQAMPVLCEQASSGQQNTRTEQAPRVCGLEINAVPVSFTHPPSLEKLWGSGNTSLRVLAKKFSKLLGRYGLLLSSRFGFGSSQQRGRVLPRELSLGSAGNKLSQPKTLLGEDQGAARGFSGSRCIGGNKSFHALLSPIKRGSVGNNSKNTCQRTEPVYDLLNCGPRHRFLVRGTQAGKPVIVHNCIQAIARDVFCECLLRLEAAGFTSIFTVHDEVILEVDKSITPEEVQDIIKINPEWMPDVPLDSEAEESAYYKK